MGRLRMIAHDKKSRVGRESDAAFSRGGYNAIVNCPGHG